MTIEKLAFKDYQELKYIQKIDLLLIIEFLQKDRKQWINQYSKAHNDYVHLQKELEQLKEIEKEHQKINGDLRIEIKELKDRIDNGFKEIKELYDLYKEENCYTISDKLENALIMLKGDKE